MFITVQARAKEGKHLIKHSEGDWINTLSYDLTGNVLTTQYMSPDPSGEDHYIQINSIDKENKLVSFEFMLDEYTSRREIKANKKLTFTAKNIHYKALKY